MTPKALQKARHISIASTLAILVTSGLILSVLVVSVALHSCYKFREIWRLAVLGMVLGIVAAALVLVNFHGSLAANYWIGPNWVDALPVKAGNGYLGSERITRGPGL